MSPRKLMLFILLGIDFGLGSQPLDMANDLPKTGTAKGDFGSTYHIDDENYGSGRCSEIGIEHKTKINEFGKAFYSLSNSLNTFDNSIDDNERKVVIFLGNTGSGKSTLVEVLAGVNKNIISKEAIPPGSGKFTIEDGNKIGSGIESITVGPECARDPETGVLLCDNPGFQDTRSSNHEIVATFAINKVSTYSKFAKIALVITHSSIEMGMYREDFTNLLLHICEFIKDVDKYKDSVHLIATKVENVVRFDSGTPILVEDHIIVSGIANFLEKTKTSFKTVASRNKLFYDNAIKIIDSLLFKNKEDNYSRISLFRKPKQAGNVLQLEAVQGDRMILRGRLLNEAGFIQVRNHDFGYTISDTAKLYLNSLYTDMDKYLVEVAKGFTQWSINNFNRTDEDISTAVENIKPILVNVKNLSKDIGNSCSPKDFVLLIQGYTSDFCRKTLEEISRLSSYLEVLSDLTDDAQNYTPKLWADPINTLIEYVDNELKYYLLSGSFCDKLISYDVQKERELYNPADLGSILEKIGLVELNEMLDERKKETLSKAVTFTLNSFPRISCEGNTLFISGGFIQFSNILRAIQSCDSASSIVVAATHTAFIDADLKGDIVEGRNVLVVAPLWRVKGERHISVDGKPPAPKPTKASSGEIGDNGKNGNPAGSFIGVGMLFENGEDLTISANGGNGQDGQDGGDGRDGTDGRVGRGYGSDGTRGGNSEVGGLGGSGGLSGDITVHNLGTSSATGMKTSNENGACGKDGTPGRPGQGGIHCKRITHEKTNYLLGIIPFGTDTFTEQNCDRLSDGTVSTSPVKYEETNSLLGIIPFGTDKFTEQNYDRLSDGTVSTSPVKYAKQNLEEEEYGFAEPPTICEIYATMTEYNVDHVSGNLCTKERLNRFHNSLVNHFDCTM